MNTYEDATLDQTNAGVEDAWQAFLEYRKKNLKERANFLRTIAVELQNGASSIIKTAMQETNLEEGRLKVEFKRTLFQLTSYAQACEEGAWLDIRINTATAKSKDENEMNRQSSTQVDLRKMLIPLGPVVVFGASNFPFAYSTAGGDTACALAAGCPAIIKAHPAHAATSEMVSDAIKEAAKQCQLPEAVFSHLHGASFEVGKALVQHPLVKAVGFTGSFEGGKTLFDWGNQRPVPIPVFSEMGSVNPVFLLPQKLREDTGKIAAMYVDSITQSVGQFCTNPGLIAGIKSDALTNFLKFLGEGIKKSRPAKMLHPGIAKSFYKKRTEALQQPNVSLVAAGDFTATEIEGMPTVTTTTAEEFLSNPLLHKEVFGPYSLVIRCTDQKQLLQVAQQMEGQLTTTLFATDDEVKNNSELVDTLKEICGRFILNGVPTGVEVALAMQHGGPYPATTDSRFTAVGADGIKRFARPISYQNWSNELLPDELKNENPLHLWRTINGQLTNKAIE
jgi:NADP-dependent aldehyde dehydrogenase